MPIPVRGFAPLLQVFDMPASIAFYRDALGFEITQTSAPEEDGHFDWAMLRLGDADLMLNTAYERDARPPAPDPARIAAHGDTTVYFGCPDVHAAYAHLREHGVEVQPPARTGYGWMAIGLRDPDGYGLCFHWPLTDDAA